MNFIIIIIINTYGVHLTIKTFDKLPLILDS